MKRALVGGLLTASLIAGGAVAVAASSDGKDLNATPDKRAARTLANTPDDIISEDGVSRVFGANRYETAVALSQAYLWDNTNTIAVYIASGLDYPDALALGLSNFQDGPLLLVTPTNIPLATRTELERLQPCYIDVIGGTGAISNTVFNSLKAYADPALCGE